MAFHSVACLSGVIVLQSALKFHRSALRLRFINLLFSLKYRQNQNSCRNYEIQKTPMLRPCLSVFPHFFIFSYLDLFNVSLHFLVDSKKTRAAQSKQVSVSSSRTMGSDSPVTSSPNTCSSPHSGKQQTHAAGKIKLNHTFTYKNCTYMSLKV